jgi:hypothetical protein
VEYEIDFESQVPETQFLQKVQAWKRNVPRLTQEEWDFDGFEELANDVCTAMIFLLGDCLDLDKRKQWITTEKQMIKMLGLDKSIGLFLSFCVDVFCEIPASKLIWTLLCVSSQSEIARGCLGEFSTSTKFSETFSNLLTEHVSELPDIFGQEEENFSGGAGSGKGNETFFKDQFNNLLQKHLKFYPWMIHYAKNGEENDTFTLENIERLSQGKKFEPPKVKTPLIIVQSSMCEELQEEPKSNFFLPKHNFWPWTASKDEEVIQHGFILDQIEKIREKNEKKTKELHTSIFMDETTVYLFGPSSDEPGEIFYDNMVAAYIEFGPTFSIYRAQIDELEEASQERSTQEKKEAAQQQSKEKAWVVYRPREECATAICYENFNVSNEKNINVTFRQFKCPNNEKVAKEFKVTITPSLSDKTKKWMLRRKSISIPEWKAFMLQDDELFLEWVQSQPMQKMPGEFKKLVSNIQDQEDVWKKIADQMAESGLFYLSFLKEVVESDTKAAKVINVLRDKFLSAVCVDASSGILDIENSSGILDIEKEYTHYRVNDKKDRYLKVLTDLQDRKSNEACSFSNCQPLRKGVDENMKVLLKDLRDYLKSYSQPPEPVPEKTKATQTAPYVPPKDDGQLRQILSAIQKLEKQKPEKVIVKETVAAPKPQPFVQEERGGSGGPINIEISNVLGGGGRRKSRKQVQFDENGFREFAKKEFSEERTQTETFNNLIADLSDAKTKEQVQQILENHGIPKELIAKVTRHFFFESQAELDRLREEKKNGNLAVGNAGATTLEWETKEAKLKQKYEKDLEKATEAQRKELEKKYNQQIADLHAEKNKMINQVAQKLDSLCKKKNADLNEKYKKNRTLWIEALKATLERLKILESNVSDNVKIEELNRIHKTEKEKLEEDYRFKINQLEKDISLEKVIKENMKNGYDQEYDKLKREKETEHDELMKNKNGAIFILRTRIQVLETKLGKCETSLATLQNDYTDLEKQGVIEKIEKIDNEIDSIIEKCDTLTRTYLDKNWKEESKEYLENLEITLLAEYEELKKKCEDIIKSRVPTKDDILRNLLPEDRNLFNHYILWITNAKSLYQNTQFNGNEITGQRYATCSAIKDLTIYLDIQKWLKARNIFESEVATTEAKGENVEAKNGTQSNFETMFVSEIEAYLLFLFKEMVKNKEFISIIRNEHLPEIRNYVMDALGNIRIILRVKGPKPTDPAIEITNGFISAKYSQELHTQNCSVEEGVNHVIDDDAYLPEQGYATGIYQAVYDSEVITEHVYSDPKARDDVTRIDIKKLLSGFFTGSNVSSFAFGGSGSGKTYTLIGDKENPGIISMFAEDIYNEIANNPDKYLSLSMSILELVPYDSGLPEYVKRFKYSPGSDETKTVTRVESVSNVKKEFKDELAGPYWKDLLGHDGEKCIPIGWKHSFNEILRNHPDSRKIKTPEISKLVLWKHKDHEVHPTETDNSMSFVGENGKITYKNKLNSVYTIPESLVARDLFHVIGKDRYNAFLKENRNHKKYNFHSKSFTVRPITINGNENLDAFKQQIQNIMMYAFHEDQRKVGRTPFNHVSSRSHAFVEFHLVSRDKTKTKALIADLAGVERQLGNGMDVLNYLTSIFEGAKVLADQNIGTRQDGLLLYQTRAKQTLYGKYEKTANFQPNELNVIKDGFDSYDYSMFNLPTNNNTEKVKGQDIVKTFYAKIIQNVRYGELHKYLKSICLHFEEAVQKIPIQIVFCFMTYNNMVYSHNATSLKKYSIESPFDTQNQNADFSGFHTNLLIKKPLEKILDFEKMGYHSRVSEIGKLTTLGKDNANEILFQSDHQVKISFEQFMKENIITVNFDDTFFKKKKSFENWQKNPDEKMNIYAENDSNIRDYVPVFGRKERNDTNNLSLNEIMEKYQEKQREKETLSLKDIIKKESNIYFTSFAIVWSLRYLINFLAFYNSSPVQYQQDRSKNTFYDYIEAKADRKDIPETLSDPKKKKFQNDGIKGGANRLSSQEFDMIYANEKETPPFAGYYRDATGNYKFKKLTSLDLKLSRIEGDFQDKTERMEFEFSFVNTNIKIEAKMKPFTDLPLGFVNGVNYLIKNSQFDFKKSDYEFSINDDNYYVFAEKLLQMGFMNRAVLYSLGNDVKKFDQMKNLVEFYNNFNRAYDAGRELVGFLRSQYFYVGRDRNSTKILMFCMISPTSKEQAYCNDEITLPTLRFAYDLGQIAGNSSMKICEEFFSPPQEKQKQDKGKEKAPDQD